MTTSTKQKAEAETKLVTSVVEFLDSKPLFYEKIDYKRFPKIYDEIKESFNKKKQIIVHLVGTNGKGTTGRFIAQALFASGKSVGHFTSPHIVSFNERIWLNGQNIDNNTLENAHNKLQSILTKEQSNNLSYFEYTTLLAMVCFFNVEYIVLEAGLGGEYDATAVFKHSYTVVTPVDYDHQSFLGSTIEQIATTKLNVMANECCIAKQKHSKVVTIAKEIAKRKSATLYMVELKREEKDVVDLVAKQQQLPPYIQENLATACCLLKKLNVALKPQLFEGSALFGRLSKVLPNVYVDVGHNPLAAEALAKTLAKGKFTLVYNSYSDKEYVKILTILKPIIDHVELLPVRNQRVENIATLQKTLTQLKIQYCTFKQIEPKNSYLVFGSFVVVEEFLKKLDE